MKVEFYKHALAEEDVENVGKTLRSLFLTTGPVCAEVERRFAEYTGLAHCVALNSCTAALHLGLLALGIGDGDEVITTPMTFIATATAIAHTGATPVLADIEAATGLIDPKAVEQAITPKTKAILPVHLYGVMADMRALHSIADSHGLHLLEDAAHCIEAERDGIHPGRLSRGACYSFYATKNLTCGEGGALGTCDEEMAHRVRLLRQHGMSKEAANRYHGNYVHWDMLELGWKYNLSDINASLLLSQIERLDAQLALRQHAYDQYVEMLAGIPQITIPSVVGKAAHHLFTIQVPAEDRDNLLHHLGNNAVGTAVNYRAIHTLSWLKKTYNHRPEDFPNALRFGRRTLSLPFYPGIKTEEIEYVSDTLRSYWAN